MEIQQLLNSISGRPMKVKEIIASIENLKSNHDDLAMFLQNNPNIGVTEFEVTSELMQQAVTLIDKRVSLNVVKNVYDQYSIIYVIQMLALTNKSQRNKANKIYLDVMGNTSKFDIYMKVVKNVKKISSDNITLEVFWLLPLFSNPAVLTSIDYGKFIGEMKGVNNAVPEYSLGYSHYVTSNFASFDKDAYKQFLVDGLNESAT